MKIQNHFKSRRYIPLLLFFFLVKTFPGDCQVAYRSQYSNILISGTSTLHDWEIKSDKGNFNAVLVLSNDKLSSISALNFNIPSESLKSGHSLMDNNTYKALNTKTYGSISFVLSSVTIIPVDAATYNLKCFGKLTIAGTTHETELIVTLKWSASDKSFNCSGVKKIKMTEYNIKPPTVMMGTIKTGDEISISYNLKIKS